MSANTARPLILAYADPPYLGMGNRYPEKTEVDHAALIADLERNADGWALSASSPSLFALLPLCPPKTRIAVWVKSWVPAVMNVRPVYGWEPVLFKSARMIRRDLTVDWHRGVPVSGRRQRVLGQKPEDFAMWIFRLLGGQPGDEFHDYYPGSGAVTRAWAKFIAQMPLPIRDGRPAARQEKLPMV